MCPVSFPQGLYENFLSMRVRDPNLQSVGDALDWLSFSDRLNQVILHGQNFSLMRYLPFLAVKMHFLFAHAHVPRISYPHSQHEVPIPLHACSERAHMLMAGKDRTEMVMLSHLFPPQAASRLLGNRNALSTMLNDIPACIRTRISQLGLTLDILTLLLDIICPKLRPVCRTTHLDTCLRVSLNPPSNSFPLSCSSNTEMDSWWFCTIVLIFSVFVPGESTTVQQQRETADA